MNREDLVQAVIREVKSVLAQRGVTVAPSGSSSAVKTGNRIPAGSTQSKRMQPIAGSQSVGTSDLTGKQIITQRDLEGLGGQSITVRKNAVITPLAFDYAREKGISLNKVEQQSTGGSGGNSQSVINVALSISPDFTGDRSAVIRFLESKGFNIKQTAGKSHEASVNSLCTSVSSGTSNIGICIENTGMEAPIFANRNRNIRAVHCRDTMEAHTARVDLGANVIVIDSSSNPSAVINSFIGG